MQYISELKTQSTIRRSPYHPSSPFVDDFYETRLVFGQKVVVGYASPILYSFYALGSRIDRVKTLS
jgi:hypothetical protein